MSTSAYNPRAGTLGAGAPSSSANRPSSGPRSDGLSPVPAADRAGPEDRAARRIELSASESSVVPLPDTLAFDENELRRGLGALIAPGAVHEVRALPSRQSRRLDGDDPDAAVKTIASLALGSANLYATLNPVRADWQGRGAVSDRDIERRVRLLIDLDPVRSSNSGSTDAERGAVWELAAAVRADLAGRGWPEPVVVGKYDYAFDLTGPDDAPDGAINLADYVLMRKRVGRKL